MADQIEQVESLPLINKRRILGYFIPLFNIPMLILAIYSAYEQVQAGMSMNSIDFFGNVLFVAVIVLIGFLMPWWIPVYRSSYFLESAGCRLSRFMRRSVLLPYRSIERVEVYIRESGVISQDAENYAKESSANLRKLGFSLKDYTNSEDNIVLMMVGRNIYMISPAKPRAFLKSLKRRVPKLTAKIVELHARGKNIQELK